MTLTCWPVPGKEKSKLICKAFAAGAPKSARGSVFFGTEGVMSAFQKAKAGPDPWWYIDNAYFDKHRGTYFRVTKNALQVDPRGKVSDGSRFEKLKVPIKPWREGNEGITLLTPQSDAFMKSTLGLPWNWAKKTIGTIRCQTYSMRLSEGVIIDIQTRSWERNKLKASIRLLDMLPKTRLLITYSSASAITAMLEGVPAISESGAAHTLTGPLTRESVLHPPRPDGREQFATVLADNQFTLNEFTSGEAWRWLERS